MPGLLDKLQGLLSNPTVQGLAGAAAFGANPLIGLLAGQGIKGNRDQRRLENEDLRRNLAARDKLPGLLAQRTPTDRILGVGGEPGFDLPNRRGLLDASPASVPFTSTQAGNAELQGLLTDIAPQQAVASMLSAPTAGRAPPAVIRVADELGLVGEDRDNFIRENFNPNSSTQTQQATIDLLRAQLDLQNARDERDRTSAEDRVRKAEFGNSLHTTIDNLFELADVNEKLANTGQAPGFGAGARSSLGSAVALGAGAVGANQFAGEVQGNVDLAQRFDTLANEILIDSLNTGDFDARTDTKFRQFASTKPTREGMGTRSNALAIADKFDAALLAAKANGEVIAPERLAEIEQRSKQLREQTLPPAQLLQMSFEDILKLDPDETDRFTEEQKVALEMRLGQLGL